MPVTCETSRLVGYSRSVFTPVATRSTSARVLIAMTISSSEALPARSPMPLMVHSTWRAPTITPARLFATARPRSLWQWTEMTTRSMPRTCFLR